MITNNEVTELRRPSLLITKPTQIKSSFIYLLSTQIGLPGPVLMTSSSRS